MSSSLTLAARLSLDVQRWTRGLTTARGGLRGFAEDARRQMSALRSAMGTVEGKLASLGVGVSAAAIAVKSARLDQDLIRVKQMAHLTAGQVDGLRAEFFRMGREAGTDIDQLRAGFQLLIAGGLAFDKALPTIDAINKSMAVTKAEATTLSGALLSAQEHFQFDLAKAGEAQLRLDQMSVAADAGVIELEDLSGAFAAAAVNAKAAGLNFEQTLALFEGLGTTTTKDRLGTLVDSTLRVFTNANYMKAAQKATGVKFFDAQGSRRDALEVLADIKRKYDRLRTDRERQKFISAAFGKTDLDTVKGIQAAMADNKLEEIVAISKRIREGSGYTASNLTESINNAVNQSQRLKNTLGEAGDSLARPINAAIAKASAFALNDVKDGCLHLSGSDLAVIGGGGLLAAFLAKQFGGRALRSIGGKVFGTAAGVAEGKALEAAAGVTPVFVTNYAQIGGGAAGAIGGAADLIGGRGKKGVMGRLLARLGPLAGVLGLGSLGGLLTTSTTALAAAGTYGATALGAGVAAAGVGGWYAGKGISDHVLAGTSIGDQIGNNVAKTLAFFGNQEAQDAVARMDRMEAASKLKGELVIRIDAEGRPVVQQQKISTPGVVMRANTGRMLAPSQRAGRE